MAPGGEIYRSHERFGENVLCHGSHEWLPYSKNAMRTKSPNPNLSLRSSDPRFPNHHHEKGVLLFRARHLPGTPIPDFKSALRI